jgi:hypothetical protein
VAPKARQDPVEWWRGRAQTLAQAREIPELSDPERKPRRGWNRASFDLNTHPLHPFPKVTQDDLLVPSARDRLALLGACLLCGACLSVLWVYFPLMFIAIPLDAHLGDWPWIAMGVVTVLAGVFLFAYASVRDRREGERALARF